MNIPRTALNCSPSKLFFLFIFYFFNLFFGLFDISGATPAAYGGSQAWGQIGAAAANLHHSHSNSGPKQYLQPTPQLTATPDP